MILELGRPKTNENRFDKEMRVYDFLDGLRIKYQRIDRDSAMIMKRFISIVIFAVLLLSASSMVAFADTRLSATDSTVYKNLYAAADNSVEQTGGTAATLEALEGNFDINETAYIAVAVYAPAADDYSFTLGFSVENAGDTVYAAVKAGNTVKTVTSDAPSVTLALNKGINIIKLFGATAEMGDANVKYTDITLDSALYEIKGEYYVSGDVNADGKVNLKDLLRFKKFMVQTAEINEIAGELTGDTTLSADDISIVRKYLLDNEDVMERIALSYDLTAVNRDNEVSDNWEF